MPVPSSVKYKKNGIEFLNNVDRVNYTIVELTRAALKETGKYIARETREKIKRRTGRLAKNIQYWVRKKESDLQVGFKPGGFYGMYQELGTEKVPKEAALYKSVSENIPTIIQIQAQYLSAIEDEARALSLIDESEEIGDE
jgi:HK97 gp10 family phage protein